MTDVKDELSVIQAENKALIDGNANSDGLPEAVTKEEEIITKRKTELTTTKQIETRVKRQVKFEDGKVIEDTGPIVSTATTEDTDKVESEQTEKKTLGEPTDAVDGPNAIEGNNNIYTISAKESSPQTMQTTIKKFLAPREDGLVREEKENRVVSREDTTELTETEDVHHFGDFSDAAYVSAVNSGSQNVEKILLSPESKLQLVPLGPKLVKQTINKHTTIDTEDTDLKCLQQPDGTLITEKKKTTEHEDIIDEDLPDGDNRSSGSQEKILKHKESSQRFVKQRDEQEVEYVSDGKIVAKEMRYATENEFMERDGDKEDQSDWDSLSDRVKKSRRQLQKTLLQKQRETNAINDRRDAITNRPLDFDREEETRRKETYKWLDSHFGSESTSKDSRDEESLSDIVVEPTKKSFFNVTIKSNNNVANTSSSSSLTNNNANTTKTTSNHRQATTLLSSDNEMYTNKLSAPSKVYVPERELSNEPPANKTKFFQGISDWSERKESPRPLKANPLSSKAFQEELSGTLERKQRMIKLQGSYNDLRYPIPVSVTPTRNADINPMKYRSGSREDLLRSQKEDLGYLSGSRGDLRRKYSNEDYAVSSKKLSSNGFLHREDSGFVRDSKEDLRSPQREDSFGRDDIAKSSSIQRDDSAYVSSSTYFTTPRSPRRPRSPIMKTPDSGMRSPTPPNDFEDEIVQSRPTVPQRKKAIERKMRISTKNEDYANYPAKPRRDPPIDYIQRSQSPSPSPIHHVYENNRKSHQKTRFSTPPSSHTATIPRSSIQTQTLPPKKKTVGNAIGNSLRKLVGKIRSASAERKLKQKNTQSKRSPSPVAISRHKSVQSLMPSSSYQRNEYVIDGHISANGHHNSNGSSNGYNSKHQPRSHSITSSAQASTNRRERTAERSSSSTTDNEMPIVNSERVITTHHQKSTMITSPKQRYYFGENPAEKSYSGGANFGKENKYQSRDSRDNSEVVNKKNVYNNSQSQNPMRMSRQRSEEPSVGSNITSTLGRFSKSTNRLTTNSSQTPITKNVYSSSALNESNENYRNAQTLPRKLDHHKQKPMSASTINVSIVNNVKHQNTGPAKPARTYKALQRSKSFNVHGLNGTNDPSPIYMEKLTNNNYKNYANGQRDPESKIITTTHHTTSSTIYKSTPHLADSPMEIKLKSPSIVNLISRSTRDLSQINGNEHHQYIDRRYNSPTQYRNGTPDMKKNTFLKGLHDQAPELYKTLHGQDVDEISARNMKFTERESSSKTSSRSSPIVLGKDSPVNGTTGILRRGSNSTDNDNYSETYKYQTKSNDPLNPTITDTVETFSKKTIPGTVIVTTDPRAKKETIVESHHIKKVTSSRNYSPSPTHANLKYYDVNHNNGNGGVVIELRNNY